MPILVNSRVKGYEIERISPGINQTPMMSVRSLGGENVSSNFVIAYTGRVVENRLINFVRMASLFDAETRHERITIRPVGGVREFVSPIPRQISENVRSPLCNFHSPHQ
jgi:hypothetical protein